LKNRGFLLLGLAVAASAWLFAAYVRPGLQVATGFAAKLTCSLSLNSKLPPAAIAAEYLDHELAPVSRRLTLTPADCCAGASVFGLFRARAVYRRGLGCTLLAGRSEEDVAIPEWSAPQRPVLDPAKAWPRGEAAPVDPAAPAIVSAIDAAFAEPNPQLPGRLRQTKAVLVVHDGRLVAERYADGYGPATPMLSWSMAKSVLAAVTGIAVADGRLSLHTPAPVAEWAAAEDPRRAITLDQLLRMSSGLRFDETYGAVNDVSRMLFTEPDTGAYAARSPLAAVPDSVWSYSSGTSNIIARMLRDSLGDFGAFARFANERLFDAAAMTSAFFEPDASGSPIGSSFVFMTARDWARFGELHRSDGVWQGTRVLPDGWVRYVTTPTPAAPLGQYGAHWWLNAGDRNDQAKRPWPGLPADAYAARGHSGQWVLVIPSNALVIVRLGLSFPDDGDDGTAELAAAVIRALRP
jgi:CubicO group peptidase (beta-lactamase class C family)